MSDKQCFETGGRRYEWNGGFGAIFTSRERGVQVGDVRMIDHELFFAYIVTAGRWSRPSVGWTQVGVSAESIRRLRAKFFGVEVSEPVGR